MSYAQLLYAGDMSNAEFGRFQQNINERVTEISLETLFFTLEINQLEDAELAAKLQHAPLQRFAPWLRDRARLPPAPALRRAREAAAREATWSAAQAWMRLFDETMADLRFEVGGKKLTSTEALNLLSERDGAKRKAAAEAARQGFRTTSASSR